MADGGEGTVDSLVNSTGGTSNNTYFEGMIKYKMNQIEKAILAGIYLQHESRQKTDYSMDELRRLAETADAEVQMVFTQQRTHIDPSWFMGKGKIEELAAAISELGTDLVIFNSKLSPSQIRNIENKLEIKIIDRTQLILDIFAKRARSKEGKIQVELAQLNYLLPRLFGRGKILSRLGGGIGTRGPGETKLETDRRHIRKRISELKKTLHNIVRHRELYRQRRKKNEILQVALVGYTNAGKTTLLNKLSNSEIFAEDKLFATLDPTSRRVKLQNNKEVILTDTVGFIQNLPHELIAAFRSTLEETKEADLILHVIDSSSPYYVEQIEVVEKQLRGIDAHSIPRINVYNKIDLINKNFINYEDADNIYISAFNHADLEKLLRAIEKKLIINWHNYFFKIPSDRSDLISYIQKYGNITKKIKWVEEENRWEVNAEIKKGYLNNDLMKYQVNLYE